MSKHEIAGGAKPLSRSRVDNFIKCPRCFYLDLRYKIAPPAGFPFNLNNAVDALLKREFDIYRERGEPHPYMVQAGINAVPARHPQLDDWRNNRKGIRASHAATGLLLSGAIDDLWLDNETGAYIVVDYKATSKDAEVSLDAEWQDGYKRQMEFYQWLLRANRLPVEKKGYFVYCNGIKTAASFDDTLHFTTRVLPYTGDDGWVEPTLVAIKETLARETPPPAADKCDTCKYVEKVMAFAPGRV